MLIKRIKIVFLILNSVLVGCALFPAEKEALKVEKNINRVLSLNEAKSIISTDPTLSLESEVISLKSAIEWYRETDAYKNPATKMEERVRAMAVVLAYLNRAILKNSIINKKFSSIQDHFSPLEEYQKNLLQGFVFSDVIKYDSKKAYIDTKDPILYFLSMVGLALPYALKDKNYLKDNYRNMNLDITSFDLLLSLLLAADEVPPRFLEDVVSFSKGLPFPGFIFVSGVIYHESVQTWAIKNQYKKLILGFNDLYQKNKMLLSKKRIFVNKGRDVELLGGDLHENYREAVDRWSRLETKRRQMIKNGGDLYSERLSETSSYELINNLKRSIQSISFSSIMTHDKEHSMTAFLRQISRSFVALALLERRQNI